VRETLETNSGVLSRRRFLVGTAAASTLAAFSGIPRRAAMAAVGGTDPRPRPIPGGLANGTYHVNLNSHVVPVDPTSPIYEQSSITDFDGIIASHHIQGTGTGTDLATGVTVPLAFDTDMRFMHGTYVAMDGVARSATFGFI
jgi:hypothetical protein